MQSPAWWRLDQSVARAFSFNEQRQLKLEAISDKICFGVFRLVSPKAYRGIGLFWGMCGGQSPKKPNKRSF